MCRIARPCEKDKDLRYFTVVIKIKERGYDITFPHFSGTGLPLVGGGDIITLDDIIRIEEISRFLL